MVLTWGRLCCSVSGGAGVTCRLHGLDATKVSHAAGQWMLTFPGTSRGTADGGARTLLLQVPCPPHTWQLVSKPTCWKRSGWTLGLLMTSPLKSHHASPFLLAKGPRRPVQVPGGEWPGSCGHLSLPQLRLGWW